jgi:hypothetical protein
MFTTAGFEPLRRIQSMPAIAMEAVPPPVQFTTRPARIVTPLATPE